MKAIPLLLATLVILTACETTDPGGPSAADKSGINIRQGMDASEVIALLGQPDKKESGILFNKLLMERWHYEIIVQETQDLREIDTELVPRFSVTAKDGITEVVEPVSVLVRRTTTQIVDILIRDGKVYAVHSKLERDFELPNR